MNNRIASCTAASVLLIAGSTFAGDSPPVQVTADINGDVTQLNLSGDNVSGNFFLYQENTVSTDYEIDWNIFVNNDLSAGVAEGYQVLQSTVTFTNLGLETMDISLDVALTDVLMPGSAASALYGGSIAGTLTGGELGGSLSNSMDNPLYSAVLDSANPVAELYDSFNFTTDPFDSVQIPAQDFGVPVPSLVGETTSQMSVLMQFELSGLSTVAFTSTFVAQIPAPGAAVLLGAGILVPRRRRRKA